MDAPKNHDGYYTRLKDESGETIARSVWRVTPPKTRGEVVEAVAYATDKGPSICFAETLVSTIEWVIAHHELSENK